MRNQAQQGVEAAWEGSNSSFLSRRSWLLGAMASMYGIRALARDPKSPPDGARASEAGEIAEVQATAKKAGLGPLKVSRNDHFLGVGDAPDPHRDKALEICKNLGAAFLTYFGERGFKLAFPAHRLTVITLRDKTSYGAYIGEDPGEAVGGHYDLETNRLVVFDFRDQRGGKDPGAELVNLFSLVHEATHLLCFNTGLLSQQADVPACISEGLATYVELWHPKDRSKLGAVNRPRLKALLDAGNTSEPWIRIGEIIADDDRIFDPRTEQLAYAESWLLVHYLLKTNARLPRFRDYLKGLPPLGEKASRVEYAEARLGKLSTLDRELKKHAGRLL